MELKQLQYFLAVAEDLNFSRAAERLNMTQPPLSLQIQHLEKELGFPLFKRNHRLVELTPAGKVFAEEIHKWFEQLQRAIDHSGSVHRGEKGTLTIGFVGSATYDILPSVLREFRTLFPEVVVHLLELSTPAQLAALHEQEIDVGVLRPPVHDDKLFTEIISTVPCVLAVPKEHPLTLQRDVKVTELAQYPFIMLSRKTWAGLYEEIVAVCNPMIQQEAFEFQTVIGLVAAGLGIAVVPQSAMNLHTRDVVYLQMGEQLPAASMGVSWRRTDTSPLVKAFIRIAQEDTSFL